MKGWRGALGSILALSVIYAITDIGAAGRLGGLFTDISKLIASGIQRLSNPATAGLKDFSKGGALSATGPAAGVSTGLTSTARGPNPDAPIGKSSTRLPRNSQLPTPGFNKPLP